jgi:hypothetical protein
METEEVQVKKLIAFTAMAVLSFGAAADPKNKGTGQGSGKDDANRGDVVSECNHRANERKLKGQDRQEWVDWCIDRGAARGYRDDDWNRERNCYRNAYERGLTGDARRDYLRRCVDDADRQKSGKNKD